MCTMRHRISILCVRFCMGITDMRFKCYSLMADMQGLAVNGVKGICVRLSTDVHFLATFNKS